MDGEHPRRASFPFHTHNNDYTVDILRNCNLGNTLKDTFNLNSSRCQPEVNEGSNISKSLIVIHDFMTVDLSQNLVLFHTT